MQFSAYHVPVLDVHQCWKNLGFLVYHQRNMHATNLSPTARIGQFWDHSVSSYVASRARQSTFGTTPSDRRCDTNGWHPQPEVSQLSPFLSRNRKDRVRLTPQEQPPSSRTLRSENPRTHESRFGLSEFKNLGKVFFVESYRPNASQFGLPVSAFGPAKLDQLFQWRRYLLSLCHARAYALPTQKGNYQLLRCIN